jgi:hypothetical protein
VQNFYPSIYTHSIDWAIHGKSLAKASHKAKKKTVGSAVDKAFQSAQDGQTIGVAIGPDTSLIAAECIMVRVEEVLRSRIPKIVGYRYIDDFELAFSSQASVEVGIAALHEALAIYELSLNPRKTNIVELPEPQRGGGIYDFGVWDLSTSRGQRNRLVGYFDTLFKRISEDRWTNVAAFAVARLRSAAIQPANWPLVQDNLLQLLVVEPSCARYVAEIIGNAAAAGFAINKTAISQATDTLVEKHGPMRHGSEIAWALWTSIANGVRISNAAAKRIVELDDNIVALLTLHARDLGLIKGSISTTRWESVMVTDELRGENWLLSYEARIKGWLPSLGTGNHISADSFFSTLEAAGVSFYDAANLRVVAPAKAPLAGGLGGYREHGS